MLKQFLIIFSSSMLIVVSGCGGSSGDSKPIQQDPPPVVVAPDPPVIVEPDPEVFMDVIEAQGKQYVVDTVSWIKEQNIDCTDTVAQHDMCQITNVEFNDGLFEQQRTNKNQTVLVLDYRLDLHSVLRYRSRIKTAFRYDPTSKTFIADNPNINVSKLGNKLLTEVNNFKFTDEKFDIPQPAFLPAAWLSDLAEAYREAVPQDTQDRVAKTNFFSHGTKVFGYLAQHNPEAEFAVIDTASFNPFEQHKETFCSLNIDVFSSYMKSAASSLQTDIIEAQEIEFINYSGGFTLDSVTTAWQKNQCEGLLSNDQALAFLTTLTPVYQALFNAPNALGFHAGNIDAQFSGDELDLIEFDHRVRVYQYSTLGDNTAIQPFGQSGWQKEFVNHQDSFVGNLSIDLYINVGYEPYSNSKNSTPKMETDVLGMRYGAEQALYASSWTTPVATSYAIHEQAKLDTDFDPKELKSRLLPQQCRGLDDYQDNGSLMEFIENGQGHCRIQDPLRHKSDELNRMGYLSR